MSTLGYSHAHAGQRFHGTLGVVGTTAYETVEVEGADEPVHSCAFPLSHLGTASRDEYLRVMTASIAERHARGLPPLAV